jgi:hypothetical protein
MPCPGDQEDEPDIDALREEAEEAIRTYVWAGEYDPEEVCIIIGEEIFGDDEEQEEWTEAAVRRAFAEKRKVERTWPKVTDCDRLDRVFEALEKRGVVTDHDAGFTQSDGYDAVEELYRDAGGKKSSFVGYCFYTSQDLESAIEGGGLMLAYGHFSDHANKGVEIGQIVREEFERAGFAVEWDGHLNTRILLKGFRWQKRSPR